MSTAVSPRRSHSCQLVPAADSPLLPHWSVTGNAPRSRVTPEMESALRDLLEWGTDLAMVLTNGSPDDQIAIRQVYDYIDAALAGQRRPELDVHDVLTTAAALMSGFDMRLRRARVDAADVDVMFRAVAA